MERKEDLRVKIKEIRKNLDAVSASERIAGKICNSDCFINAKNVMLFYPMRYEINLLGLLNTGKNFYFPKVDGKKLLVCPACEEFEKSALSILEPCSEPVRADLLDLIIVPALAVDRKNYRLGYGGGFYDRFLGVNPGITTLTPVFKEFVFDVLPHDPFDVPVNFVVSD